MIPTKTYPLSAIMGGEISDKERIAELADAYNRLCAENADFVAESIKAGRRIEELQNAFEDAVTRAEKAENRIAELLQAAITFKNYADDRYNKDPRSCAIINTPIQQRLWLAIKAAREGK